MSYTDDVVLESPNNHYKSYQPGAVLEFADFKRFLVADGRESGAEYRFDSRVSRPILDDDGVIEGVRYNGDEEVYAEVVVDATGPAAPIASALDVVDLERKNQAIGIEYEMEGVEMNHPEYADLRRSMMLSTTTSRPAATRGSSQPARTPRRSGSVHPERPPPRVRTGEPDRRRLPRRVDRPRPPLRRRDEDQREGPPGLRAHPDARPDAHRPLPRDRRYGPFHRPPLGRGDPQRDEVGSRPRRPPSTGVSPTRSVASMRRASPSTSGSGTATWPRG